MHVPISKWVFFSFVPLFYSCCKQEYVHQQLWSHFKNGSYLAPFPFDAHHTVDMGSFLINFLNGPDNGTKRRHRPLLSDLPSCEFQIGTLSSFVKIPSCSVGLQRRFPRYFNIKSNECTILNLHTKHVLSSRSFHWHIKQNKTYKFNLMWANIFQS